MTTPKDPSHELHNHHLTFREEMHIASRHPLFAPAAAVVSLVGLTAGAIGIQGCLDRHFKPHKVQSLHSANFERVAPQAAAATGTPYTVHVK